MRTAAEITTKALTGIDKEHLGKEHAKHQRESGLSRVAIVVNINLTMSNLDIGYENGDNN